MVVTGPEVLGGPVEWSEVKAILVLADGTVYEGESIGQPGRALGEVVFSTGMVGYQQAFTDPSFRGQILKLTYPLIGNYGTNDEDYESPSARSRAWWSRRCVRRPATSAITESLGDFLTRHGVVGISRAWTPAR